MSAKIEKILDLEKDLKVVTLKFNLYKQDISEKVIDIVKKIKIEDLTVLPKAKVLIKFHTADEKEMKENVRLFKRGILVSTDSVSSSFDFISGIFEVLVKLPTTTDDETDGYQEKSSAREVLERAGSHTSLILGAYREALPSLMRDVPKLRILLLSTLDSSRLSESFNKLSANISPSISQLTALRWKVQKNDADYSLSITRYPDEDDGEEGKHFHIDLEMVQEKADWTISLLVKTEELINVINEEITSALMTS